MSWTDRRLDSIRSVLGKRFASSIILILFIAPTFLPAIVSAQGVGGSLRIDSVNPNSVAQGGARFIVVEIIGDGFIERSLVYLKKGGITLNPTIEFVNTTLLRATIEVPGPGTIGSYNVTVWNPDGQEYTLEDGFTVTEARESPPDESPIRIDYVSPNSGSQGEIIEMEIIGDGFFEGGIVFIRNEAVRLNTATLFVNTTLLRVTFEISIMPLVIGSFNVTVWNPDGQEYTLENGFTVTEAESRPPGDNDIRIDSVSPNSGREGQTLQIEIVGSGFGSSPASIRITIWGATIISEDLVSPTLIRATIWIRCDNPNSFLDVLVDDVIRGSDDVIRQAIAVIKSPEGCPQLRVDSVTPTSGKQGETLQLEIVGDGFNPGTNIDPPLSISSTEQFVDSQHLIAQINISSNFPAPQEVYFIVRSPGEIEGELQTVRFYFNVERATTTTTSNGEGGSQCIIATATYGSALAPEVQFLRTFRDETVLSTFAGANFMTVFNSFYYSWSPAVAAQIEQSENLKAIGRIMISPLLGILHASTIINSVLSLNSELAIVITGVVASSLIGAVYLGLPVSAGLALTNRSIDMVRIIRRGIILLIGIIASGSAITILGAYLNSTILAMIGSATLVLSSMAVSALLISSGVLWIRSTLGRNHSVRASLTA